MNAPFFKRRLKPSRLPHPIRDEFTHTFFWGVWLGICLTLGVAALFVPGVARG